MISLWIQEAAIIGRTQPSEVNHFWTILICSKLDKAVEEIIFNEIIFNNCQWNPRKKLSHFSNKTGFLKTNKTKHFVCCCCCCCCCCGFSEILLMGLLPVHFFLKRLPYIPAVSTITKQYPCARIRLIEFRHLIGPHKIQESVF